MFVEETMFGQLLAQKAEPRSTGNVNRPAAGLQIAREKTEQSGLTRAVGTNQGDLVATRNAETNV